MSTIFGIKKGKQYIEVAFRGNVNLHRWLNPLAEYLPNHIKLKALDNTQQGIYTIGDFKKFLKDNK